MAFRILGIETSCDETSAAVVQFSNLSDIKVLSDVTARQEEIHERFGGIVPELASRRHLESLLPVVRHAIEKSGLKYSDLSAISVTTKPGLIGSLLIGVNGAKTLCYSLNIPLISINHLEAHLSAILLEEPAIELPALGLIVSGGHTSLYKISDSWSKFSALAHTRDDAAGEAFDKGARLLGLPYPGGPQISKLAEDGNPSAIEFPRSLPGKTNIEFSFSGLKTSLSNYLAKNPEPNLSDLSASFQEAIVDSLVEKTKNAIQLTGMKTVVVAGGVAANNRLREKMEARLKGKAKVFFPSMQFCTDNGAMVAAAGVVKFLEKDFISGPDLFHTEVAPKTEARARKGKVL
ncbi:MAG: tRNA (adenosine(37)-N6)-threonylcarbamoyltransferase complex transferase subunit TsaD [Oligoflexia bacterium]|nr:tRNA (adenosine(37)-N6)-threonylcarbamoyltransferase complex transferase subunit TsaD [Oligoflexia bacterium]